MCFAAKLLRLTPEKSAGLARIAHDELLSLDKTVNSVNNQSDYNTPLIGTSERERRRLPQ